MKKQSFKIIGMSCSACAARVEKVTSQLDGVFQASINFATEKLKIEFDENVVTSEQIKEIIENAGYKAIDDILEKEITIPIGGMSCAACSQRVQKVLSELNGVINASVNIATEKATVKYNPSVVRISQIKSVISNAVV